MAARVLMAASAFTRARATPVEPKMAAVWRGVEPLLSTAFGSALWSSRTLAARSFPRAAAQWSGVQPLGSLALASAGVASSSFSSVSTSPFRAALWPGPPAARDVRSASPNCGLASQKRRERVIPNPFDRLRPGRAGATQWSEESPEGAALQTVLTLYRKAAGLVDSSLRSE